MLSCSVRSKVRGTLEIYHAYIRDHDFDSSATEPDWEIVDTNDSTVSELRILVHRTNLNNESILELV